MIPQEIDQNQILEAITQADLKGHKPSRNSEDYDLWYRHKTYPPKVIISYARQIFDGVEHPSSSFGGGRESNQFLIERGFPIVRKNTINPTGFFTREEIDFFNAKANKPYNKNNLADENAGAFLNEIIWEKCKNWADRLCENNRFKRNGTKTWNEQRRNNTGQAYKAYAWYRINPIDNLSEDVFYTVGLEGRTDRFPQGPRLVIKLDCRRKKLSQQQQDDFDLLLNQRNVKWHTFSETYPETGNWEGLITDSLKFIEDYRETYHDAVNLLRDVSEPRFARMAWNDNGWIAPSGREGKSTSETHEHKFGYGHEEWLFDTTKEIEESLYGRLEPLNTPSSKYVGKTFDLYLFTNKKGDGWKWVGRIHNAEAISHEESIRISKIYEENGWMAERVQQLSALSNVDSENYEMWQLHEHFNVKYRVEDLELFDLRPFEEDEVPPAQRYILAEKAPRPAFLSKAPEYILNDVDGKGTIMFVGGRSGPIPTERIKKRFLPHMTESDNIHGQIQSSLYSYLTRERGHGVVDYETRRIKDNSRVDIVEQKPEGGYIFYEIKSYPSVRHSIRVALGQLFEYAYYDCAPQTDEFVIVTHLSATLTDLAYLKMISEKFRIKVSYIHFDIKLLQPVKLVY